MSLNPITQLQPTDHASRGRLTPRELLVLQLSARGYSLEQISALVQQSDEAVSLLVNRVTHTLGAPTWEHAVEGARRRGLVL